MLDPGYLRKAVNGVPVVSTPAEIDMTTAEQLRAAVLEASSGDDRVIVVDMSRTLFCDSAGLHTLLRAHRGLAGQGRELRLVVSPDGAVPRIFTLTGLGSVIGCFASIEEALAAPPAKITQG